jgi:hypothetical protein
MWLQVAVPKFDAINAEFDGGVSGLIERPVEKTVALNSNLNSVDQRTGLSSEEGPRKQP